MSWNERIRLFFKHRMGPLESRKQLLSNFFSLGFLRVTDALILILIIPIIINRIGIANYGIIALVQVFLNYGKTTIDYGFNITGVRQIALANQEQKSLNDLFFNILYTRVFICLVITGVLFLAVWNIPYLYKHAPVFFWGSFLMIGHVVFTDWFFIGLKQAGYIAWANLVAKLLYAILVILLIRTPSDTKFVLAFQGIAALVTGISVLIYIQKRFSIGPGLPRWKPIWKYLRSDFKLLLTNVSIEFNASYSILVLNFLTNNVLTGYYSIMQKLVQPLRFLLVIFSQTIFPVVCEKTVEGWHQVKRFLGNTFFIFFVFPIIGVLLLTLFARPVLDYFSGGIPVELVTYFQIFLMVPVVILFNIPAYQVLLAYERKSDYTLVYILSICINVFLAYFLTLRFELPGLIAAVLITELFITLGLYFMVWINRKKIKDDAP